MLAIRLSNAVSEISNKLEKSTVGVSTGTPILERQMNSENTQATDPDRRSGSLRARRTNLEAHHAATRIGRPRRTKRPSVWSWSRRTGCGCSPENRSRRGRRSIDQMDSIDFGIIACERSVPHVADIALGFGAAVADLFKIALDERAGISSVDGV